MFSLRKKFSRRLVKYGFCGLFAVLLNPLSQVDAAQAVGYNLGTIATDIPIVMVRRMEPLAKHISQHLGIPIQVHPAPNMQSAIDDFGRGETQIAYFTPVAYLEARERFGATPIVLPLTKGQPTFRLAIVVHQSSPHTKLSDLTGKTFAFGDSKSLLQRATVESGGVRLDHLSKFAYLKHFDNVGKAVLNRDFDAGIMKESLVAAYPGLRIIHLSPPLPTYVIAVNSKFPAEHIPALRKAFTSLDQNIPLHRGILHALDPGYSGFQVATDAQLEPAQRMIAPYKKAQPAAP